MLTLRTLWAGPLLHIPGRPSRKNHYPPKPMNTLPASFPPVDALIETLSAVDWKRTAHRALMVAATVLAVVVAVSSWLWHTARAFWADHGAAIQSTARQVASRTATAAVTAWQAAGPVMGRIANRAADGLYYWVSEGRPVTLPLRGPTMAL